MLTDKLRKLEEERAKIAELEKSIATELNTDLASLPNKYGFATVAEFVAAVTRAARGRHSIRGASKVRPAVRKKQRRAKITPEMKARVKSLVEAGKTGNEIAKMVGISLPSVHNVKKELGLTVPRGKKKS